ncbi:MAG: ABC transporter ATP-binding protein [Limnothrix sp.]
MSTNALITEFMGSLDLWKKEIKSALKRRVKNPAYRVVLSTVNYNRGLVAINFNANLLSAIFEGSSFGLIFFALQVIESPDAVSGFVNNSFLQSIGVASLLIQLEQGQLFMGLIVLAIALQYLRNTLEYAGAVSSDYLSARIQAQMTEKVFRHVMTFSFTCASRYKVGDLTSYINLAAPTVRNEIYHWNIFIVNLMTAIAQLVLLLSISPALFIVAAVISIGLFSLQRILIPKIRQTAQSATQAQVGVTKHITESIQGLRVIHTFATQTYATQNLHQLEKKLVPQLETQSRSLRLLAPLGRALTLTSIGLILLIGFGILQNQSGMLLSSLVTFLAVLSRLTAYLNITINTFGNIAQNSGDFNRLAEILDDQDKEFIYTGKEKFEVLKTSIKFKNVSLQYSSTEQLALTDISFELPKGKVIALVGGSGAGKSSITDLLIGLYQPTSGEILIDGHNLQNLTLESWRSHLGVVSQDTFIFNESILENIRYGNLNASEQEVRDAAIAAQADQFINELPDGYSTVVGERGYRLSGGQRQRLALARAILRKSDILILDEATSALDSHSEKFVQEAISNLSKNCTIILVAHRLSTVSSADEILVIEKGHIVERGSHKTLLECKKHYYQYWQKQSQ